MLLGRSYEEARITALLESARTGRSGALVLRGEAGIGKTALLETAAATSGFLCLRARGLETESEIGFSALHDVIAPVIDGMPGLPRPQSEAIAAALSIGPAAPTERLAICAGLVGLLAIASENTPVLVIVDDAHLLDRASADALGFAARRLRHDRIAMIFAIREGEGSSFATDGIDELPLDPLDHESSDALLDRRAAPLTAAARSRVLALARGNPLAILELPIPGDVDPSTPAALEAVSTGGLLARAFGRRIERLPSATRTALAVAASSDDDDLQTVLAACRSLAIEADAFAPAEEAGVIEVGNDAVSFRHPLLRAAAYAEASPAVRRDAHRALAAALVDGQTEERWAWHRALAAVGPDEPAASALEASAGRSKSVSSRARALERAARLSRQGPARTRRLVAAALAAEEAGALPIAESLATAARRDAADAAQVAEIDHLLGRVWTRMGQTRRAVDVLTKGAALVAPRDQDRAARMLADAVDAAIDDLDRAEMIADEAVRLLQPGSSAEQLVRLRRGDIHGWRGEAERASESWRRAADLADPNDPWSLRLAAEALFSAGLDDRAVETARSAVQLARDRTALNSLTQSLEFLAQAEARRGRLRDGLDVAIEELDLVTALSQTREERYACVAAAWIEAALGLETACRAHAARAAELEARMGWSHSVSEALGVLELGLGRPDLAIEHFDGALVDTGRIGADAIAPRSWVPAYVEALVRVGRASESRPIAVAYAEVAEGSGLPLAIGLASRCLGLAEGSLDALEAAITRFGEIPNRYEEARTRLCLGELLRRRGKRGAAGVVLELALRAFEEVGAEAWSERTRSELALTGAPIHRVRTSTLRDLTPQERNVARLVAAGLTNRDIAERLFVTTNTVETHLRHIFEKLEVASRTQLAIQFRD
jgi:DNA-binding CsgD family transcriptional regulator